MTFINDIFTNTMHNEFQRVCANVFKSQAINQSEAIFLRHGVRLEDKTGAAGSTNFIYTVV